MSRARNITHNGVTMSAAGWARQIGVSPSTILSRLRYGWSVEQAVTITERWTHPNKRQTRTEHDMRDAVRLFADEMHGAIDAFEQGMLNRLKGVAVTPPGEGENFPNGATDRSFSSAQDSL